MVTTSYDERENLQRLIPAIQRILAGTPHEVIAIDDSSPDGSIKVARALAQLTFSKPPEGQARGLWHGMQLAKHEVAITIDSELRKFVNLLVAPAGGHCYLVHFRQFKIGTLQFTKLFAPAVHMTTFWVPAVQ